MRSISQLRHDELVSLRLKGMSIPEISRETGTAKSTVRRHINGVVVPEEFKNLLREKQGGAKLRAQGLRDNQLAEASRALGTVLDRDRLFLLIGLYWGEGTKRDFSVINSDPMLIQAILSSLPSLGISKDRISLSLRVHSDISVLQAKTFWSKVTGLPQNCIGRIEIIEGKKKGKLPHGMCRIRVRSGIRERLLIQSAISLIGKDAAERVISS